MSDATTRNETVRFVVLHHLGAPPPDEDHFDLMIELPGAGDLETFRVPHWPLSSGDRFDAVRLRNHRRHYLTHQGEVPGGRGHVHRVAEGEAEVTRTGAGTSASVHAILTGPGIRCVLVLDQVDDANWSARVG